MGANLSASDRAYTWVRQHIFDGTLAEGDMISEGQVADLVGVSRTPVREAFLRLAGEGTLRLFPKRGAIVVPLTRTDTQDMLEARLLVEPWAVRKAAELDDRRELAAQLAAAVEALEAASVRNDMAAYHEADRAFHETILTAADNSLLADLYRTLRDLQLRVGARALASSIGRAQTIVEEHRRIQAAVAAGDADGAETAIREHIETTRRLYG